jgi:AcrR family transcriptional regulator
MDKRVNAASQTRQNIIDAFWALYCRNRIEKIRIKDITNKAGYNRGTFYEYFTDVYDVLGQIENSLIPALGELPPLSTPGGSFGMPLELFFELYEQRKKYYNVLLGENGDPGFAGRLKNSIKQIVMKSFTDKNTGGKELDYILEYALSAMIGVMNYWFRQEDALSNTELYELISRLTEQGVTKYLPF